MTFLAIQTMLVLTTMYTFIISKLSCPNEGTMMMMMTKRGSCSREPWFIPFVVAAIVILTPTVKAQVPSVAPSVNVNASNAPSATWGPTATSYPTGSRVPTSKTYPVCNICGVGNITLDDNLQLPVSNITCTRATDGGMNGMLSPSNCKFLQKFIVDHGKCGCNASGFPTPAPSPPSNEPCNICGNNGNYTINNTNAELPLTVNGTSFPPVQCGFVQAGAAMGLWSNEICAYFQNLTATPADPCGCIQLLPGETLPPAHQLATCPICGNAGERVTAPNAIVPLPTEIRAFINTTETQFSCQNLQQQGQVELWDPFVCAYLQMTASDTCACKIVPTAAPFQPTKSNLNNSSGSGGSSSIGSPVVAPTFAAAPSSVPILAPTVAAAPNSSVPVPTANITKTTPQPIGVRNNVPTLPPKTSAAAAKLIITTKMRLFQYAGVVAVTALAVLW